MGKCKDFNKLNVLFENYIVVRKENFNYGKMIPLTLN